MLIDIHAHHTPVAYAEAMVRFADAHRPRGWVDLPHTDSSDDLARRLELMDQAGVGLQVLSHGIMAPYLPDEDQARAAAQASNDGYAELIRRYPDRFGGLVACRCRTSTPRCESWSEAWTTWACGARP